MVYKNNPSKIAGSSLNDSIPISNYKNAVEVIDKTSLEIQYIKVVNEDLKGGLK